MANQGPDRGSYCQFPAAERIDERVNADGIPGTQQPVLPGIPDDDRERARHPTQEVVAAATVGVQNERRGVERLAQVASSDHQLVVGKAAVEDNRYSFCSR